jgi:hypothetical protein
MKKWILPVFIVAFAAIFTSCEEEPPPGLRKGAGAFSDTTFVITNVPTAEDKNVLIEDLTGTNCVNCPKAADTGKALIDIYQGRVIMAGLYLTTPFTLTASFPGYEDLRTQEAEDIANAIYLPSNLPSGYIDRAEFGGNRNVDYTVWSSEIKQRLALTTPVNIDVDGTFSDADSNITVNMTLVYTEDMTAANHAYTIMILEDSIKAAQKAPNIGKDPNYIHYHVLRTTLTPSLGSVIQENKEAGRVIKKSFKGKIGSTWKAHKCNVYVLVQDSDTKEVIHIQEAHIK